MFLSQKFLGIYDLSLDLYTGWMAFLHFYIFIGFIKGVFHTHFIFSLSSVAYIVSIVVLRFFMCGW